MNEKTSKMIRKYARLRGAKDKRINYKVLKHIFDRSTVSTQEVFKQEMKNYFQAIEDNLIEPGDSYLHSVLGVIQNDVNSEQNTSQDT